MNNKYIDISSAYRNRSRDPLTSCFDVLFSDCGSRSTLASSHDPYSTATASFPPLTLSSGDSYSSHFYIYETGLTNTYQIDGVVVNGETLQNPESVDNLYVGQVLENTASLEARTIVGYTVGSDTVYFSGTASGTVTDVILTGTQSDIDDYYVGKILTVNGETRTITDFLEASNTVVVFPALSAVPSGTATITGPTFLVELESDFTSAITTTIPALSASNTLGLIRGSAPSQYGTATTTANPTTTIKVTTGQPDIYTGNFLHLFTPTGGLVSQYVQITAYDDTTGDLTITPAFAATAGSYDYALLQFSGDNHYPLNYTGSRVSNQQMTCHEISLVSLTLPNLILKTGGKIAFKPYVYVELTNLTSNTPNHIWSNNPNANRALFKVSVNDDVSEPNTNPFVTLLCQCMDQTINFKPNDNFKFSVRLPNGDYFEVVEPEQFSPAPPNPNIQIDALFRVKKVC
jgi:hypothetical protein